MGKKNFTKGIDNVFSPTTKAEIEEMVEAGEAGTEKGTEGTQGTTAEAVVSYNVRYPKELQKRIKRFCIEHDGVDMKDVFVRGAVLYMERYEVVE
jgi:hypothetical protein